MSCRVASIVGLHGPIVMSLKLQITYICVNLIKENNFIVDQKILPTIFFYRLLRDNLSTKYQLNYIHNMTIF